MRVIRSAWLSKLAHFNYLIENVIGDWFSVLVRRLDKFHAVSAFRVVGP